MTNLQVYTGKPLVIGRKRIYPLNTQADGTCRTIKAQYFKTSVANFLLQTSRGGLE